MMKYLIINSINKLKSNLIGLKMSLLIAGDVGLDNL